MRHSIRLETEADYREVEEVTREAFWNLYVPGCDEHYLAHIMRDHSDFIPELDFVAVADDKIVGNIMYTKSRIVDKSNNEIEAITFGPISVLPNFQKRGYGSALIQHSKKVAQAEGHRVIIIEGHPHNYCKHGFKGSKTYNISDAEGKFPFALLVLEIEDGLLSGNNWKYFPSEVYNIDGQVAEEFDKLFPDKKKEYNYTQEEFLIASQAYIN